MLIYYKKYTNLVKYIENIKETIVFKKPGLLEKLGLKKIKYPDIYFHTGTVNNFSNILIKNSKITIVNSTILKNKLVDKLNIQEDKIKVIYPAIESDKFKKKDRKKSFYAKYNINDDDKIIYFTGKNLEKSGIENFCKIINNLEMDNFKAIISTSDEKESKYAKEQLKFYKLEDSILLIKEEIFDITDIFVLPTKFNNFAINILKAMVNKSVAFVPETNYSVEIVDIFSIMSTPDDSNTSYKIDMLLRVNSELKKIQKENYKIAKKLTLDYQCNKLDKIINILENK
jgi:glycosyltransferase involved in cell wall biosynthesis